MFRKREIQESTSSNSLYIDKLSKKSEDTICHVEENANSFVSLLLNAQIQCMGNIICLHTPVNITNAT